MSDTTRITLAAFSATLFDAAFIAMWLVGPDWRGVAIKAMVLGLAGLFVALPNPWREYPRPLSPIGNETDSERPEER